MEKGEVGDFALILALLHSSAGIEGRTRLQKMIYLLRNSFDVPFSFGFRMYFYGPYSESLAEAIQVLKAVELIEEEKVKISKDIVQYNYRINDAARDFVETHFLSVEAQKREEIYSTMKRGVEKMSHLPTKYLVSISKKHYAGVEKAFYFFLSERSDSFTGEFAMSLSDFCEKIKSVNHESLVFHFYRGDFEKWFSDVLEVATLSEELKRLRQKNPPPENLRDLLCDIVLTKKNH